MNTLLIDTEGGTASIANLIGPSLLVERAFAFPDVERIFWNLQKVGVPEVVAIDTLTTLATTTRQDVIADPDKLSGGLWTNRDKLFPQQRDWGSMTDLLARLLRMYRALPTITIFTAHEDEREDLTTGETKIGPSFNPALLKDVIAFSDVVAHLGMLNQDVEIDGTAYAAGTRRLRLVANKQYMAKVRVPRGSGGIPAILWEPTLGDLLRVVPGCTKITLYGPPGVGKTTFACSGVEVPQ